MFYTWETGTFVQTTEAFVIGTNGEEVSANLSDFPDVSLKPAAKKEGRPTISLRSQTGVETTGPLILRKDDKEAIGWALVARLPELADTTMLLIAPSASLKQSDGRASGGEGQPVAAGPSN